MAFFKRIIHHLKVVGFKVQEYIYINIAHHFACFIMVCVRQNQSNGAETNIKFFWKGLISSSIIVLCVYQFLIFQLYKIIKPWNRRRQTYINSLTESVSVGQAFELIYNYYICYLSFYLQICSLNKLK